jgi:hypothetical protein
MSDFELPESYSPLESLLVALRETRLMHACPYLNGTGTCVTGCWTEPHCITDCPDRDGWQPEITRLELLVAMELEAAGEQRYAGGCWLRSSSGRLYHPKAPQGLSFCHGCHRVVVRGMGRWWE